MRNNDALQLPPEEPQQAAPSLGRLLRAAREAEHWSIDEIAAELRIEPRFLVALEEERLDAVGPPVFTKGYLKLYCGCLGLDFAQLLPLYRELIGEGEAPLRGRRSVDRRASSNSVRWVAIGLAVLVLVVLAAWLLIHYRPAAPAQATASGTPAVGAAASPGSASTAAAAAASPERPENPISALQQALLRRDAAQGEAATSGAASASGAASPSEGPLAEPAPAATPASVRLASSPVPAGAVFTTVASAANGADARTAGSSSSAQGGLEIELQFIQDSWVEVTDARKQRLYYGLGKVGDESRVRGVPPLEVLLGNADGVVVEVAGHPYRFPKGSRAGKVARFDVTAQAQ